MADNSIDILLVEDNPNDVELTLDALKENRLTNHIQVVRDGVAALDFLFCTGPYEHRDCTIQPKLILLDLKLPKLTGLEVLKRIRANPNTKTISVVILTSSREERDIVESYEQCVNSYIVKPVDFEQFTAAVKQLGFYWLLLNQSPHV
jgi:two-component system response regulator